MRVVTGIRYLGRFIGDPESKKAWIYKRVTGWTDLVEVLEGVARRHQQTAYAGL